MELPPDTSELSARLTMLGLAVASWLGVDLDRVFDLEVTTNRPDCLGHIGVAREVAAILMHGDAAFAGQGCGPSTTSRT